MSDYSNEPLHRLEPTYLEYYGLNEPPFSAMVDDHFYFSTAESRHRMSLLVHMTQYSDMVLIVRGESGMGKTTLVQNYIKSAHDNWHICRINANNMMDREQLLFRMAEDFGIEHLPADSAELQELLYDKMTQLHHNDILPVIIIDDAHELTTDAINQLFIMAEIKADDTIMVHIVLFAEPGIDKVINASNTRKIRERIGHDVDLTPLDEADTAEYILSRLTIAGLEGESPFSKKVIRQIHKQSQGNPARINELAHMALDKAAGGNEQDYVETYEDTDEAREKSASLFTPLRIAAVIVIASLAGLGIWQQDQINQLFNEPSTQAPIEINEDEDIDVATATSPFARLKEKTLKLIPTEPSAEKDKPAEQDKKEPPAKALADSRDNSPKLSRNTIEQIEDPAIAEQLANQTPVTPSPVPERIEPAKEKKVAPTPQKTTSKQPLNTEQWIHAQPANHLTLQLLGSHHLEPIKKYIQQYELTGEARIYKTSHDNKDWYILLYGNYASQQEAQETIRHLPQTARARKPWIRSFASIRKQAQSSPKKPARTIADKVQIPAKDNIKAHEAWLWGQNPSHYTLQLLGTQNINNIKQFIKQHQLRGKVVYYHTQRNKQDWYTLLYGAYPNNTDAKTAVSQLPPSLKRLSPWVRNFSAIHGEMDKPSTR